MNVSIISGLTRSAGGVFYAVNDLCFSLKSCGVKPSIFGAVDEWASEDLPAWEGMDIFPYSAKGPLGSSNQLRKDLAQHGGDLAHVHGLWMDNQWAALQWQKKRNRPVVISPHGMLDPWAVANSGWKKKAVSVLFAAESLKRSACLHALNESEAQSIRQYGLDNPIAIIPNGVNLPDFGNITPDSTGPHKLLFLGRIHPKKGIDALIQSWAQVSKSWNSTWELLIAGWDDGRHQEGIEQLIRESGLEGSVFFVGPKFGAEKDQLLRDVDAFILPSHSEGLPVSVLEAWSYGLPVIMTDACNIPEGFTTAAAIKVEPKVDSISDGLNQLVEMTDSDLNNMGLRGRDLVEQRFIWHKIAENFRSLYERVLGGELKTGSILRFEEAAPV